MQATIKARSIEHVWHFTRLSNLDSILQNGLINREELELQASPPDFNDHYRYDLQKDAVCCSIGHPNYKLFYRLRINNPEEEWVVIGCEPSILWEKDCAFCVENAASNNVTCIPIQNRKGLHAFNEMFEEIDGVPSREDLALPNDCPTNPQAEILVFETIEPEQIVGAICPSKAIENELKIRYPNFEFLYHRAHYSARKDYGHWK